MHDRSVGKREQEITPLYWVQMTCGPNPIVSSILVLRHVRSLQHAENCSEQQTCTLEAWIVEGEVVALQYLEERDVSCQSPPARTINVFSGETFRTSQNSLSTSSKMHCCLTVIVLARETEQRPVTFESTRPFHLELTNFARLYLLFIRSGKVSSYIVIK